MLRIPLPRWSLVLLSTFALGLAGAARADTLISNSQFQVGIGTLGNLYNVSQAIGFNRISDGYDPIFGAGNTFPRESWGISDGSAFGYVDPNGTLPVGSRVVNIVANPNPPATPPGASALNSTFLQSGGNNLLQIDQSYKFVANNVLEISMKVTNLNSLAPTGDVLIRRNVDWAIPPWSGSSNGTGSPNQLLTYPAVRGQVTSTTSDGLAASPNPLVPYYPDDGFPNTNGGGTFGPAYIGAGLTYDLGTLLPGASQTVNFFYADSLLGQTHNQLAAEVAGLGGNFEIVGWNAANPNAVPPITGDLDSSVLAVQISVIPEPATLTLFGLGLVALAGWRRRRRSV